VTEVLKRKNVERSSLTLLVGYLLAALYLSIFALNPRFDNVAGASHSGVDLDRIGRAVLGTGTAFHAPITVTNRGMLIFQGKYTVGTHNFAHAAADTGLAIQLKCGNSG